jgi:NDP-sugar pyrophosphorylase family protein
MCPNLKDIYVVILCGGLGNRLRSAVSDRPKVLAEIKNKSFLDILIDNLLKHGFINIILCVGYLKEQIKDHFDCDKDFNIIFSEEEVPLGTGGALKNARPLINSDPFMLINGDSICDINFKDFLDYHVNKRALMSMVLTRIKNTGDYGNVVLDESNRIVSFKEKIENRGECLINAGIYLMQKDIFLYMPEEDKFSLEYDLFPKIVNEKCYGFIIGSDLIDIGTPERYEKAINLIGGLK